MKSTTARKPNPWPRILRRIRRERDWTQAEAAEAVGVPLRSWINWENAHQRPRRKRMHRLKELFGFALAVQ